MWSELVGGSHRILMGKRWAPVPTCGQAGAHTCVDSGEKKKKEPSYSPRQGPWGVGSNIK